MHDKPGTYNKTSWRHRPTTMSTPCPSSSHLTPAACRPRPSSAQAEHTRLAQSPTFTHLEYEKEQTEQTDPGGEDGASASATTVFVGLTPGATYYVYVEEDPAREDEDRAKAKAVASGLQEQVDAEEERLPTTKRDATDGGEDDGFNDGAYAEFSQHNLTHNEAFGGPPAAEDGDDEAPVPQ